MTRETRANVEDNQAVTRPERHQHPVPRRTLPLVAAIAGFLLAMAAPRAEAQTGQFWPELDTYVKVNSTIRLFFSAKTTREDSAADQRDFGAHVDVQLLRPAVLSRLRENEPDESKLHVLLFRAGYHYIQNPDSDSHENRIVLEVTPRYAIKGGFALEDRNRTDLRFTSSGFQWRYRNRLTLERPIKLRSYRFTPYARVEFWYESAAAKWDKTGTFVGCEFPINKLFELESYFEHQNITSKSPNQQVNGVGLIGKLYF